MEVWLADKDTEKPQLLRCQFLRFDLTQCHLSAIINNCLVTQSGALHSRFKSEKVREKLPFLCSTVEQFTTVELLLSR